MQIFVLCDDSKMFLVPKWDNGNNLSKLLKDLGKVTDISWQGASVLF